MPVIPIMHFQNTNKNHGNDELTVPTKIKRLNSFNLRSVSYCFLRWWSGSVKNCFSDESKQPYFTNIAAVWFYYSPVNNLTLPLQL